MFDSQAEHEKVQRLEMRHYPTFFSSHDFDKCKDKTELQVKGGSINISAILTDDACAHINKIQKQNSLCSSVLLNRDTHWQVVLQVF